MKKLMAILLIVLMALPVVMAQNIEIKPVMKGFENAQIQENEQKLEQVMQKIQEQDRLRLNQLENLQFRVENNINLAEGIEEKEFLGLFKVKRKAIYQINNDGEITKEKRFGDSLFR